MYFPLTEKRFIARFCVFYSGECIGKILINRAFIQISINYFKTEDSSCQRKIFLNCTSYTEVASCTRMGTSPHCSRCNMTNRLIMTNKFTPATAHQSNQVLLFTRHDTPWCVRLGIRKDNVSDRLHPDATPQNAILTISRVATWNFCWEALSQDPCWLLWVTIRCP